MSARIGQYQGDGDRLSGPDIERMSRIASFAETVARCA